MSRGFRVWDNQEKTYNVMTDLVISPAGHLMEIVFGKGGIWEYNYANEKRYIVELDTGLKDKNGKEIYEGDIVQTNYMNAKGWVVWTDGAWDIALSENSFELFLAEEVGVGCEVIGNIHENGELLEASDDN